MKRSFLERVKQLNLPADQYVVVGSGLLEVLSIREAEDIDIVVSDDLYQQLRENNSDMKEDLALEMPRLIYRGGEAEVWTSWPTEQGRVSLEDLVQGATLIEGVRFASLDFVEQWKRWRGRDKDKHDIELIKQCREASQ